MHTEALPETPRDPREPSFAPIPETSEAPPALTHATAEERRLVDRLTAFFNASTEGI